MSFAKLISAPKKYRLLGSAPRSRSNRATSCVSQKINDNRKGQQKFSTYIMFVSQRKSQRLVAQSRSRENFICRFTIIDFCSAFKKNLAYLKISMLGCEMQCGVSAIVNFIDLGAANEQQINCRDVLLPDSVVKSTKSLSDWFVDLKHVNELVT